MRRTSWVPMLSSGGTRVSGMGCRTSKDPFRGPVPHLWRVSRSRTVSHVSSGKSAHLGPCQLTSKRPVVVKVLAEAVGGVTENLRDLLPGPVWYLEFTPDLADRVISGNGVLHVGEDTLVIRAAPDPRRPAGRCRPRTMCRRHGSADASDSSGSCPSSLYGFPFSPFGTRVANCLKSRDF